jgi:hypothetical protein
MYIHSLIPEKSAPSREMAELFLSLLMPPSREVVENFLSKDGIMDLAEVVGVILAEGGGVGSGVIGLLERREKKRGWDGSLGIH